MSAASQHNPKPPNWVPLPTETEIYILPDGRVVIADLPAELGPLIETLGTPEACEITPQTSAPGEGSIQREIDAPTVS